MKRRSLIPKLYGTLFEISMMRQQVHQLEMEVADPAAQRFLSQLQAVEAQAIRLIDRIEIGREAVNH